MIYKIRKYAKSLSFITNSILVFLISNIDFSDLLIVFGLSMLFYGLYLFIPWVAYTIIGTIIFLIGSSGYIAAMVKK